MKLDIPNPPRGEALIGFVLGAVVLTFVLAFAFPTESGLGEKTVTGSPTPEASPTPQETFDVTQAAVPFDLKNGGVAIHNMRIAGPDGSYTTGDDVASVPHLIAVGVTGKLHWT